MTRERAWDLFFATGLPQAYLAAKRAEREQLTWPEENGPVWKASRPAFQTRPSKARPV